MPWQLCWKLLLPKWYLKVNIYYEIILICNTIQKLFFIINKTQHLKLARFNIFIYDLIKIIIDFHWILLLYLANKQLVLLLIYHNSEFYYKNINFYNILIWLKFYLILYDMVFEYYEISVLFLIIIQWTWKI